MNRLEVALDTVCLADVAVAALPTEEALRKKDAQYKRGFTHGLQEVINNIPRGAFREALVRYRDCLMEWRYTQGAGEHNHPSLANFSRKNIPPSVRWKVLKRDRFSCSYCGTTPDRAELVVDHVVPVCKGGKNEPENLVCACRECNAGKGADEVVEASA